MPGGDRTGPFGQGPMTGRGAGFCAGQPTPGFENPGWGYGGGGGGRGWGRGGGRGGGGRGGGGRGGWRHRNWYHATGLTGWQRAGGQQPAYAPPPPAPVAPRMSREQELEALRRQAEYFQQSLEELNARIGELESSDQGD